ncbi:hypothetical protein PRIPAC_90151 [Pristionchus pacificus]|uniref:Uncharacterized protein n=1 Tax=Pristionchus pacificus TaxID=54126 RepID=A0A2A6B6C4_PRIPA|nr:hypothetical protein PRIPAC_90151 [Pristionchus pacificus]|eukprot:PDM61432.1 hypothetical protein PRIPAC_50874 [Pristionchus pacificus]
MRLVSLFLVLLLPILSQAFLSSRRFSTYDPLAQEQTDDNRAQFLPSVNSYCFFHRDVCRRLASTEKRFYRS